MAGSASAGTATGELLWRLPLHPNYAEDVKSEIADVRNSLDGTPGPGASIGAAFINYFVDPALPWAHLDIAGTAWSTKDRPLTPKGATAWGVRLLDRLVADHVEAAQHSPG